MLLGAAGQAWSALIDNLYLSSELERRILTLINSAVASALPTALSDATEALAAATTAEVSDYFSDRRDYLESVATLDFIVVVERNLREDLEARLNGFKSGTSLLGSSLLATPKAPGQKFPAVSTLLRRWKDAGALSSNDYDAVDDGMQYRNWLVHGGIGISPLILNPFLLDVPVQNIVSIIQAEP
ncbi:MAG: hypothetical protein SGI99_18625 [Pseudomonadota bacterium]|nr:hypothetical protein [Pseudomonadota bacterium]